MRNSAFLQALLFVFFGPVQLTPATAAPQTMSCNDATRYMLKHNPSLKALRQGARIALRRLEASRLFPSNPILESIGKGKAKADKFGPYKLELALTWKLPIGGWWGQQQHLAKAIFDRVQSEISVAQFSYILKLQKTCYELLLTQQKARLYEGITSFYQRTLQLVKKRKRSGAATALDLNLAQLELLQSQGTLSLTNAERKAQRRALSAILGWTHTTPPQIKDDISRKLQPHTPLKELLAMSQQHVSLKLMQASLREAQNRLNLARSKAIPDLKIKMYYAFEEGDNHIVGGGLSLPIPLLWRNQTKIWTNKAKLRQTKLKLHALRFKFQQQIHEAHTRYQAGWKVFQLYERSLLPTLKKQLQLRERGLNLGAFTILQVISAQQSQNKAMLKRIESLKQVLLGFLQLQQATGQLLLKVRQPR